MVVYFHLITMDKHLLNVQIKIKITHGVVIHLNLKAFGNTAMISVNLHGLVLMIVNYLEVNITNLVGLIKNILLENIVLIKF
jgi:hypothetical protein